MPTAACPQENSTVDALTLAQRCRKAALLSFPAHKTSCIETTEIFVRAAELLGLSASRVVCRAVAYSPKLAAQLKSGTVDKNSMGEPGIWSVGVGINQHPGDYLGRMDTENNRFVGHVVCVVEDYLVDPSVDQLSRPEWEMALPDPVMVRMSSAMKEAEVAWLETTSGVLLKYLIHPEVTVPRAKRAKIIERLAQGVVREMTSRK